MSMTWAETPVNPNVTNTSRTMVGTCAAGTEGAPADADDTAGIDLNGVKAIQVYVESTGAAFTAGRLDVYVMNPRTKKWALRADLAMDVQAVVNQMFQIVDVDTMVSRLTVVPVGLTTTPTITLVGDLKR